MDFPTTLLAPILIGALLNLDKQVFGPFMVGRPLVVGFVIGLVSGETRYGLWMGLSAELLWLATMPLGGQLTPNSSLAVTAAFTTWLTSDTTISGSTHQNEAGLVLSFLTIPFWARAFMILDIINRNQATRQVARARARLAAGSNPHFFFRNLKGGLATFICSLGALMIAVMINSLLLRATLWLIPDFVLSNFGIIFTFIPFLGLLGMAVFLESKTINLYFYGLLASLLALTAVS